MLLLAMLYWFQAGWLSFEVLVGYQKLQIQYEVVVAVLK